MTHPTEFFPRRFGLTGALIATMFCLGTIASTGWAAEKSSRAFRAAGRKS